MTDTRPETREALTVTQGPPRPYGSEGSRIAEYWRSERPTFAEELDREGTFDRRVREAEELLHESTLKRAEELATAGLPFAQAMIEADLTIRPQILTLGEVAETETANR